MSHNKETFFESIKKTLESDLMLLKYKEILRLKQEIKDLEELKHKLQREYELLNESYDKSNPEPEANNKIITDGKRILSSIIEVSKKIGELRNEIKKISNSKEVAPIIQEKLQSLINRLINPKYTIKIFNEPNPKTIKLLNYFGIIMSPELIPKRVIEIFLNTLPANTTDDEKKVATFFYKERIINNQIRSASIWIEYFSKSGFEKNFIYLILRLILQSTYHYEPRGRETIDEFPAFDPENTPKAITLLSLLLIYFEVDLYNFLEKQDREEIKKLIEVLFTESEIKHYAKLLGKKKVLEIYTNLLNLEKAKYYENVFRDINKEYEKGLLYWFPPFSFNGVKDITTKVEIASRLSALSSLANGICIAGIGNAIRYLERGDIYLLVKIKEVNIAGKKVLLPIPEVTACAKNRKILEVTGNVGMGQEINPDYFSILSKGNFVPGLKEHINANRNKIEGTINYAKLYAKADKFNKELGDDLRIEELRILYNENKMSTFGVYRYPLKVQIINMLRWERIKKMNSEQIVAIYGHDLKSSMQVEGFTVFDKYRINTWFSI